MGNPIAEILVHKVVWFSDRFLGTNVDMDSERGMKEEEVYYLTDTEIVEKLIRAGFGSIRKKIFLDTMVFEPHICRPEERIIYSSFFARLG